MKKLLTRLIEFQVKDHYVDEYTREHLDMTLTTEAILDDMEYYMFYLWRGVHQHLQHDLPAHEEWFGLETGELGDGEFSGEEDESPIQV